ncbi:MAG: ABC-type transport auxiliary lipoprotein family protein [Myxococcota bacterium]
MTNQVRQNGRASRWASVMLAAATGCLSARAVERNYFVLHGDPVASSGPGPMKGMVRVRDMDTDSVYEKFQIVIRRSPYQLRYSNQNVWAVRPNQMVSDLIAQALENSHAFTAVTRQLGDVRPSYTMSGKVSAIELYDSGDLWFAHLSLHMHLSRFEDGASLWSFDFDRRKEIEAQSFDHGVRALSELLHEAIADAVDEVGRIQRSGVRRAPAPLKGVPAVSETPSDPPPPPLLYVPEATSPRVRRSTTSSTAGR